MKKSLSLIVSILSLSCLIGCNNQKEHTHSFKEPTFDWTGFNLDKSTGNVYLEFDCKSCDYQVVKKAEITSDIKEATCTETGYKKYTATYIDGVLGGPYTDIKEINITETLGHDMSKVEALAPTCQRAGNVEYYVCSNCNNKYADITGNTLLDDISVPKLEHHMTKVNAKAATCTEDGAFEHYHCDVCNIDYSDSEGLYILGDATIKKGHRLIEHKRIEPTCINDGSINYYECAACNKLFDDSSASNEITNTKIEKLEHVMTKHDSKEADCFTNGNIEYYSCSSCHFNYTDIKGQNKVNNTTTKKEHVWALNGNCLFCTSKNFLPSSFASRSLGDYEVVTNVTIPEGYNECYKVNGDLGGGTGTNKLFKELDISGYSSFKFAVKTTADASQNQRFFLKTWDSTLEVLAADGWVNVTITKVSEGTWTYSMSNDRTKTCDGITNLYGLLNFHYPNSVLSTLYMTEIVGYKENGHAHKLGELVTGRKPSCLEPGTINHYQCKECSQCFDENYLPVETIETVTSKHTMVDGRCTVCKSYIMDYKQVVENPSVLTEIDDKAPVGYTQLYKYNQECGGGTTQCFFKHYVSLKDVVGFTFAILSGRNTVYNIRTRVSPSNVLTNRIPWQSYGEEPDFVYIKAHRSSTSSTTWEFVSSQPAGSSAGPALDFSATLTEKDMDSSLWGVCCITNQHPGASVPWDPIIITEMVLIK